MYYVDSNTFMNGVMAIILATAVALLVLSVLLTAARGRGGRRMSFLYMLTAEFVCFGLVVCVLGFRGQHSGWRPWHFFLDMKYQPKYTPQGESKFFADGRAMRTPVEGTVPFDGTDYAADAGFHAGPKADFLKADPRYYAGLADATFKLGGVPKDGEWKDGKFAEGTFVGRIPDVAVTNSTPLCAAACLMPLARARKNSESAVDAHATRPGRPVDDSGPSVDDFEAALRRVDRACSSNLSR